MGLLRFVENQILSFLNNGRNLPLQIDITNACNLRCTHCYHSHHSNKNSLTLDQWKLIIDDYFRLINRLKYKPMIILCGGEPTISPHYSPILKYIYEIDRDSYINILTNGTTLNEDIIASAIPFRNLTFQVSLDGPDAERHDLIRGKGNFDRSIKGLKLLKSYNISFTLLCVLGKRSSLWIEDFFKLSQEIQPDSMNFTRFVENGYAIDLKSNKVDRMLHPLELKEAFTQILKKSAVYKIKTKTEMPLFNLIFPGLGRNARFWESLIIDYQGNLLASSRSSLKIGNVLEKNMETLFLENPMLKKLRKGEIEICGKCKFFNVCGGDRNAAFATYGNFLGPDPGCWLKPTIERQKMKTMKKCLLSVISLLPIKSLATVAESVALDIAGEEQKFLLSNQLKKSRSLLMPKGVYFSTLEEAKLRLQTLTGINTEEELNAELLKHMEILEKNGILIRDENKIVSGAPSIS